MASIERRDRVVVVGGGFAGFWAALAARRAGMRPGRVVLVSREPVLELRPRLYEAYPETLGVDLLPLLRRAGVLFHRGEAVGVDLERRVLLLASEEAVPFGRLVVASGSRIRKPPVPGIEWAWSIDDRSQAIAFDRRLRELAADASPTVVVVGGGFTGIELALELRDRFGVHGGPAAGERARIVLLDRAETVGAELGSGPRPVIEAALAEARVETLLGATLAAVEPGRVRWLRGGEAGALETGATVIATGMEASPFALSLPGDHDTLGRLVVGPDLRLRGDSEIFVAGDAAHADTGDGRPALQSCQHALQMGRFAGDNAARDILGLATRPYRQLRYVTCLDLGRSGAVFTEGWDRAVTLRGGKAKRIKRWINRVVIHPPEDATGPTLLAASGTELADQPGAASRPFAVDDEESD